MPNDEKRCDECGHPEGCGCGCRGCVRDHPIAPDPLLEGIDPECCGAGGFAVLRGLIAPGGADGLWRLYRTWELDEYVLLRDEDIVAQRQLDGQSIVWICGDHLVRWVRVRSAARLQQEFLDGSIARHTPTDRPPPPGSPIDGDWDGPISARSRCRC